MAFQFSNSITSKMNKPSGPPPPPPPPPNFDEANAIWSTKLRISAYTGACLKLRRSTDSVIADFYANASGNLGTGVGATGTSYSSWKGSATTYVHTWYDQSGKGNDMYQTTNNSWQPIYSDISGVTFDGLNTHFERSYTSNLNTNNFTIISSATSTINDTTYGTLISSRYSAYINGWNLKGFTIYRMPNNMIDDTSNTWYLQIGIGTTTWGELKTNVVAKPNTRFILAFNLNSTTITSSVKNTSTAQVTGNTTTLSYSPNTENVTRIGAGNPGAPAQYFFKGYINDLFYFGTSLTTTEQSVITNLL